MSTVRERFLRYVAIDTQSEDGVAAVPSTEKQWDLARLLVQELTALGAQDVALSEHGYVTATIPASADRRDRQTLGLLAHMDTSDAVSGANVSPVLTPNYDGGEIDMGNGYTLSPAAHPALLSHLGEEIICADGTTLLGADDKAGVAEIMTLCERLLAPDAPPHGRIRVGFTPDEEVGRGVDFFDVPGFQADFAYTVDGGALGEINLETFNAAAAQLEIQGVSTHTGDAKGRMVNAGLVAMDFHAMLPPFMNPACTEGYEGFFHLEKLSACADHAKAKYLIRDHDRTRFAEKKALLMQAAAYLNEKYGAGTVTLTITDSYYNMKERIDERLIVLAEEAMREAGVAPVRVPIRGGTDGARLSYEGLPCPNLCTGGENYHGRYEYIPVEDMEQCVQMIKNLLTAPATD